MPVGWEAGSNTGQDTEEAINPCLLANTFLTCTNDDRAAGAWLEAWDDDIEVGNPDCCPSPPCPVGDCKPYDRLDASSPPLDLTWPSGQSSPGREAYSANIDGEWVGMGWRTDTVGTQNFCQRRAFFAWPTSASTWPTPMVSVDLDEASGWAVGPISTEQSRATCLSRVSETRARLIVGGEDIREPLPRAVIWCGHEYSWARTFLDELTRFDDVSEFTGQLFSYGLEDNASLCRISAMHDMNASGHMVVTLTWSGAATGEPGIGPVVEFPCVVTLASDFNGDFRVDSRDVSLLSAAWGTTTSTFDLDGDATVGSGDFAYLLGQYSGADLCDLHSILPCSTEEGELLLAEQNSAAEEDADSVLSAINALGFGNLDTFAAWCAVADEEAAASAVATMWALWGGGQ
jgi:hypothetical protein